MPTKYPRLREALAPSHRMLSDSQLESTLRRQQLEAGAVEDWLDDLGNIAASALPVVGGAIGSVIAPGVGTAIGSGLGSLAGSALHSAVGGQAPAPATQAQPVAAPIGSPGAATSQQTMAALMQVLAQPATLQAIASLLLGHAGTPTVPVANNQIPVSAFTNLLSTLAGQVSEAYNSERAVSGYAESTHYGGGWSPRVDVGSPEARAGALLNLMSSENRSGRAFRERRLRAVAQAVRQVRAGGRG